MDSVNEDGFLDECRDHEDVYIVESFPVYVMESITAGAASALAKTAAAPLERVKILFQTRAQGFHSIGVAQSLKKMVAHEGLKGNGVSILRMFPYSAFHHMTYQQCHGLLLINCPSVGTGPFADILADSAAGGTAFLCTYPLDLARTKLAYQVVDQSRSFSNGSRCIHSGHPAYRGITDVFRTVYREGGFCAFYKGVGPTLGGILPYTGSKYLAYEELRTCPLDVVQRQKQVDIQQRGGAGYKNTMQGLVAIVQNQGWRQLYSGASINYMKAIPSVAICFTSFDLMKHWLHIPSRQEF
ncbi:hypothetical protein SLEP1_g13489 [Rubroshorea leprosula]|uniref:Mitochondrial carrier protein n=1 Tax=Rubroshorea leprosula TaxID=152421 RepID=A0AAV5IG34_9ROSI|nr:hypothetical protein SLEP1_g13489 [Rubroshorea leprosula]